MTQEQLTIQRLLDREESLLELTAELIDMLHKTKMMVKDMLEEAGIDAKIVMGKDKAFIEYDPTLDPWWDEKPEHEKEQLLEYKPTYKIVEVD